MRRKNKRREGEKEDEKGSVKEEMRTGRRKADLGRGGQTRKRKEMRKWEKMRQRRRKSREGAKKERREIGG